MLAARAAGTARRQIAVYSDTDNYGHERLDHLALRDHLIASGTSFGMRMGAGDSMGPRRIEGCILDNGSDIDPSMTPDDTAALHLLRKADTAGAIKDSTRVLIKDSVTNATLKSLSFFGS